MDVGVLTCVTAALALWSARAWYRVIARRRLLDGGRARVIAAGVISALAVTAGGFEIGHHMRQELATDALRAVTNVDGAHADCERFSEELFNATQYQGYVYDDGSSAAHLRRGVCHDLWDYARGGQADPSRDQIIAVHVVAHEATHINGIFSEAVAECEAVQSNHLVAQALGATPAQARELQRRYYAEIYPDQSDEYFSRACGEGGDLDIHSERTEFP